MLIFLLLDNDSTLTDRVVIYANTISIVILRERHSM